MKKILLFLLLCCCLAATAQQRKIVKVTTIKGSVFQGPLVELKAFVHVIVDVDGKYTLIPFEDMAYIDEIKPIAAAPVFAEPEPAPAEPAPAEPVPAEPEPIVEVAPVVPAPIVEEAPIKTASKWSGYKGFLLDAGNTVYINSMSAPKNIAYDEAAVDVLTRQVRTDGFWRIADRPEDAHFVIFCNVSGGKTILSISSDVTDSTEELETMKTPEDLADITEFRKQVWELYKKCITPLQRKIEKNTPPKHILKLFTVE